MECQHVMHKQHLGLPTSRDQCAKSLHLDDIHKPEFKGNTCRLHGLGRIALHRLRLRRLLGLLHRIAGHRLPGGLHVPWLHPRLGISRLGISRLLGGITLLLALLRLQGHLVTLLRGCGWRGLLRLLVGGPSAVASWLLRWRARWLSLHVGWGASRSRAIHLCKHLWCSLLVEWGVCNASSSHLLAPCQMQLLMAYMRVADVVLRKVPMRAAHIVKWGAERV